jgi:hypothetical protein
MKTQLIICVCIREIFHIASIKSSIFETVHEPSPQEEILDGPIELLMMIYPY